MLLLSTAYFPPIQYFSKLYAAAGALVHLEACETFVKQTYRSRCRIVDAGGVQILSLPVEHGLGRRQTIRELRLSGHGDWQRTHMQAIRTAYGASPFFEYYWDEIETELRRPWVYLWDMNLTMIELIASMIDLDIRLEETKGYLQPSDASDDWRYRIRPKHPLEDFSFAARPYYQPFAQRRGFVSNASILDLLFNMGPEALLVLRDSVVRDE
ncbi:MAG: WbqC family protein [Porphyromonadaceae bacterium]|nr:WbqC family protein [Porphyromonadaceae bacterium]